MSESETVAMERRELLAALTVMAGGVAVAGCRPGEVPADPMWSGFDERITERTLAEAEKLMGLKFTESERRLMLGGQAVEPEEGPFAQRAAALRKWREIDKPNGLAPATIFDPRLPGIEYPPQPDSVSLFGEQPANRPVTPDDLAFASLKELSHWMATGQVTSAELTELYLERIAGRLRGPLHGILHGLKDIVDTAGVRTTWGAAPFRDRIPQSDAAVTRRLREAGAVLLGKTSVGAPANDEITALTNLSGHPTLTLRAGFEQLRSRAISGVTEEDADGPLHSVPDAFHLWSGLFQEGRLIAVARALEETLGERTGWGRRRPPLTRPASQN